MSLLLFTMCVVDTNYELFPNALLNWETKSGSQTKGFSHLSQQCLQQMFVRLSISMRHQSQESVNLLLWDREMRTTKNSWLLWQYKLTSFHFFLERLHGTKDPYCNAEQFFHVIFWVNQSFNLKIWSNSQNQTVLMICES